MSAPQAEPDQPPQYDEIDVKSRISNGNLNTLHEQQNNDKPNDETTEQHEAGDVSLENNTNNELANVLDDNNNGIQSETSGDITVDEEAHILKVKVNKKGDEIDYHVETEDEFSHGTTSNNNSNNIQHTDTLKWFRMGTDRSQTPIEATPPLSSDASKYDLNHIPTQDEQYEEFILHLRHAAGYKAEFDIYQVLAYRAKVSYGQKVYFKPFKSLRGMISEEWSNLEVRWLNSFQRVLSQAIICWAIQTLGVTAILATQFSAYFAEDEERAQCDYHSSRWKTDWHLKLLAFLWTSFISLGISGWVYRARHSGFYPVLLFLRRDQYPNFVSITILQIGLLTNYYVVTSSVIGSFILIYQTEGGTETIDMILQAVALFFVLELDNKIVHARDFLSIRKYFENYIRHNKHKKVPYSVLREQSDNIFQKEIKQCKGNTCLSATLSIASFILLVAMTIGAFIAPWIIMICW